MRSGQFSFLYAQTHLPSGSLTDFLHVGKAIKGRAVVEIKTDVYKNTQGFNFGDLTAFLRFPKKMLTFTDNNIIHFYN